MHEDTERVALEGDLAPLREAWRAAEVLAGIADQLLIPSWAPELDRPHSPRV